MYRYVYEITPDKGEKKKITLYEKKDYDYAASKRIKDMIELFYNGHASWRQIEKEEVK